VAALPYNTEMLATIAAVTRPDIWSSMRFLAAPPRLSADVMRLCNRRRFAILI
jgi:hypothetical protein